MTNTTKSTASKTQNNALELNNEPSFAEMFAESTVSFDFKTHEIISAKVINVDRHHVTVDAGLPVDATIPRSEFLERPEVNDEVKVIVFAFDDGSGKVAISHHRAIEIEVSELVEKSIIERSIITARVASATRAGLLVKVGVLDGFLPNSLVDVTRIDNTTLIGKEISVVPLSIDEKNRNVVVSRKEAIIVSRGGRIEPLKGELAVGDIREGIIKNILRFGAFVDLGGKDCLIHISDMNWDVTAVDPLKDFEVGQRVTGLINKTDGNGKFFMSLRQANMAPWIAAKEALNIGDKVKCKVHKFEDKMEDKHLIVVVNGVSGLIPITEVSWTHKTGYELYNMYQQGSEIEAIVTGFNEESGKESVSLSLKQTLPNPWADAKNNFKEGSTMSVSVKAVNEFNIIVSVTDDITALVPFREISWGDAAATIRDIHAGDEIDVKILTVEPDSHKVIASIRETQENPLTGIKKGLPVTCRVTGFSHKGSMLFVDIIKGDNLVKASISARQALPAKSNATLEQSFSIGDKVDGEIIAVDGDRIQVSLKTFEGKKSKKPQAESAMANAMKAAKAKRA